MYRLTRTLTTDASGDASVVIRSGVFGRYVNSITVRDSNLAATTADLKVEDEFSSILIFEDNDGVSEQTVFPRQKVVDQTGTDIANVAATHRVNSNLKITVENGGNAKSVTVDIVLED